MAILYLMYIRILHKSADRRLWLILQKETMFARVCAGLGALTAGSHCYSVGDQMPDCYDTADLTCDMLVLSVRNYILPSS